MFRNIAETNYRREKTLLLLLCLLNNFTEKKRKYEKDGPCFFSHSELRYLKMYILSRMTLGRIRILKVSGPSLKLVFSVLNR